MSDDSRYAYAVGRVRALETGLLDKSRFEGLIAARDAEEALRTLSDTDYGPFLSELKGARDFGMALNAALQGVLRLVSDLSRDPELTDIFRLRYDFHNLKVLIKIKYLGDQSPAAHHSPLMDAGLIDPVKMRKIVEDGNYRELPEGLRTAAEKAVKAFEETHNVRRIDVIIDREMYALFLQRTGQKGHPFLREYFQIDLDLINIKNFLRVQDLKLEKSVFEEVFLAGGKLEKSLFLKSYEGSVNDFISLFSSTPYGTFVSEGIKHWQENRSWAELERLSDNYLLSFLKRSRYVVFGLEPLIAYLFARENEIKMIRMVMIGKLSGLPVDLLRSRLRNIY